MTPAAYGTVKAQLKAREDGGWKRVSWSLARRPQLNELELVHARLIASNPKVSVPCCLFRRASLALHDMDQLQRGFRTLWCSPWMLPDWFMVKRLRATVRQRFSGNSKKRAWYDLNSGEPQHVRTHLRGHAIPALEQSLHATSLP